MLIGSLFALATVESFTAGAEHEVETPWTINLLEDVTNIDSIPLLWNPQVQLLSNAEAMQLNDVAYGELQSGDHIRGSRYHDAYKINNSNGSDTTVVVNVESNEFDTYLYLIGDDYRERGFDDDGGDELNSRLTRPLPAGESMYIVVTSFGNESTGNYTLSVDQDDRGRRPESN